MTKFDAQLVKLLQQNNKVGVWLFVLKGTDMFAE
tara:strand:+ start:8425 stop:8526 length:102 start_codon:yes stop_codon:yes gene_type:complete